MNLLKENGVEPEVVRYLEKPPDAAPLRDLLKMLGMNSSRKVFINGCCANALSELR